MAKALIEKIFPDFEEELQREMEDFSEIRHFKAGEELMRTGQYFKSTLLIIDGLIKVFRQDGEGNEFFMYYLQPGQACALSMVDDNRQSSSSVLARVVKDTDVIAIPLSQMNQWMTKYKSWYQFVLENYRARFEELLKTIDHIAFQGMDERLAFYLKRHQDTLKTNLIETSHQEIADELNSSREVISRLLKKMEQLGKLKLHRNAIEIIKLP